MDDFAIRLCRFLIQVVLALFRQACQPSKSAQEIPNHPFDMNPFQNLSAPMKTASVLFMGSILLFEVGCGGSKETTTEAAELPTSTTQPATAPAKSADTGKMAIPFEIAIQAALEGHVETVQQALETGTDPNQVDENGRNLLMLAAFNGHTPIAQYLIDQGSKIDTQDSAGRTALMFASTGLNMPTVQLLLNHKAKVNVVDSEEHWSALMFAAAEGHKEVVELLLQHEADLSLQDIDGSTAESFARDNGHLEVADLLKARSENP